MKKLALAAAFAVLLPLAARADLLRYNFTGVGGSSGYIDIDVSGAGDVAAFAKGWSFTWAGNVFNNDNTLLVDGSEFVVDSDFYFIGSSGFVVTHTGEDHGEADYPAFGFTSAWTGLESDYQPTPVWRAVNGIQDSGIQLGFAISRNATNIPEPSMLPLIWAGGLALAVSRRGRLRTLHTRPKPPSRPTGAG